MSQWVGRMSQSIFAMMFYAVLFSLLSHNLSAVNDVNALS